MFNEPDINDINPCSVCGRGTFSWDGNGHCAVCHQNGHRACSVCGRCMADLEVRHGRRIITTYRNTCSNACRQRRYRKRVTAREPFPPV